MTARLLNITRLSRTEASGEEEDLRFEPGVNVILGGNNAGKTVWLTFLDVLLGDTNSPKDALGDLAEKYLAARAELTINGEPLTLERRWAEPGGIGRIFLDGQAIPGAEFSAVLLERLNIPVLHFPKGNPHDSRSWPELSWRMLFRQVYRHEGSWQDLAYKQPDAEQHAVLLQFLGAAKAIFSPAFGEMVRLQKKKDALETRKEQFQQMLEDVARELVTVPEAGIGFTKAALAQAIARAQGDVSEIQQRREAVLQQVHAEAESGAEGLRPDGAVISAWSEQLGNQRKRAASLSQEVRSGDERVAELTGYRRTIEDQFQKLHRARRAGTALAQLKVTHCPACDQPIPDHPGDPHLCSVCRQPQQDGHSDAAEGHVRIDFELQRMKEEGTELDELTSRVRRETGEARHLLTDVQDEAGRIEGLLRAVQREVSWIVPPEIMDLDQEIGRMEERIRQLRRLESTLALKDQLGAEVDDLSRQIAQVRGEVERTKAEPAFEATSDSLAEAMTDYLNALEADAKGRWGDRRVEVEVDAESSRFLINGRRWPKALGGHLRAYFFMAYHYALLKLSRTEPFTYPGFAILDFPANLSEQMGVSDQENYLLEPFIGLLSQPEYTGMQLLAAGRAFQSLEGAHVVVLRDSWF